MGPGKRYFENQTLASIISLYILFLSIVIVQVLWRMDPPHLPPPNQPRLYYARNPRKALELASEATQAADFKELMMEWLMVGRCWKFQIRNWYLTEWGNDLLLGYFGLSETTRMKKGEQSKKDEQSRSGIPFACGSCSSHILLNVAIAIWWDEDSPWLVKRWWWWPRCKVTRMGGTIIEIL